MQIIPLLQKYIGNLPTLENNQLDNCSNKNKESRRALPNAPAYIEFYAEDIKPIYQMKNVLYQLSYIS
ncbi:MAG TPA: hypothetical protein VKZ95_07940, partial [Sphingobacteriaceae bacterium]|nr:hypothetical protein [Sphingobacteriaceae bacterium]